MPSSTVPQPFDGTLTLYSYFRSSCSCRVRTACALKSIPLTYRYINLIKGEQQTPEYVDNINPNGVVPTLIVNDPAGTIIATITQSVAILEFLEEAFPSKKLLPIEPLARARVRELVNVIACDVQPPTNLRILKRMNGLGVSNQEWFRECMQYPLGAYEKILEQTAGRYSFGNEVTLADVCLAPALENAIRWEVDMSKYPKTMQVFDALNELEEFKAGHWSRQGDTPEALKAQN